MNSPTSQLQSDTEGFDAFWGFWAWWHYDCRSIQYWRRNSAIPGQRAHWYFFCWFFLRIRSTWKHSCSCKLCFYMPSTVRMTTLVLPLHSPLERSVGVSAGIINIYLYPGNSAGLIHLPWGDYLKGFFSIWIVFFANANIYTDYIIQFRPDIWWGCICEQNVNTCCEHRQYIPKIQERASNRFSSSCAKKQAYNMPCLSPLLQQYRKKMLT